MQMMKICILAQLQWLTRSSVKGMEKIVICLQSKQSNVENRVLVQANMTKSGCQFHEWLKLTATIKRQDDHDNLLRFLCELCKSISLSIYIDVMSEYIACINTYYQV